MDIEKEREAFEKWVTDDGKFPEAALKGKTGNYSLNTTYLHWDSWKARAELEDPRNIQVEHKKG